MVLSVGTKLQLFDARMLDDGTLAGMPILKGLTSFGYVRHVAEPEASKILAEVINAAEAERMRKP